MSDSTLVTNRPLPAPVPPPFHTEGRTREPQVEAQIALLLSLPRAEFWRRARSGERGGRGWVQEETLVCLLRVWRRGGEEQTAWDIADLLMERSARFVYQHVTCWKLGPQHLDDCIRDVQMRMLEDVLDDSRSTEFWEVRFWLCLKRRLLNIVQKYRAIAQAEWSSLSHEDAEGHTTDLLERVAAPCDMTPQQRLEYGEALAALPEKERVALVLFYLEELPQEHIAHHLGVTDRTVRNLITRAQQRLQAWYTDNVH